MAERPSFLSRKPSRWWLPGIVLSALALRVAVLVAGSYPLESDEAVVGLMARHILEGERPVFYWGQPYMGAAEAYLAAAVFWVVGSSTIALRIAPLLLALAFVCLTCRLGQHIGGAWVGLLSAAYVAVSPPFLTMWSLKARGGYVETLVLGSAIILLVARIVYDRREAWGNWAALGFLAGLALWTNELISPYLIAALITLFLWRRAFFWRRGSLASLAGLAIGGMPLWVYNWQNGMATFAHLIGANTGEGHLTVESWGRNLVDVARYSAPVLVGALQSTSCIECFHQQRAEVRPICYLGIIAAVTLVGLVAYVNRRAIFRIARLSFDPRDRETPLLVLLVAGPLLFSVNQLGYLHFPEPRYLLPLYSAVPLFAAAVVGALLRRPRWLIGLATIALALNLAANCRVDPALAMPVIEGKRPALSSAELANALEEKGIRHVYADYWIAYTLAFESDEKVIASVLGPNVSVGFNRYIPYAYEVSVAESPAYVFLAGTESDAEFARRMQGEGVTYQRDEVGPYTVYHDLRPVWRVSQ